MTGPRLFKGQVVFAAITWRAEPTRLICLLNWALLKRSVSGPKLATSDHNFGKHRPKFFIHNWSGGNSQFYRWLFTSAMLLRGALIGGGQCWKAVFQISALSKTILSWFIRCVYCELQAMVKMKPLFFSLPIIQLHVLHDTWTTIINSHLVDLQTKPCEVRTMRRASYILSRHFSS